MKTTSATQNSIIIMITLNLSTIVAITQIALESILYIKIATIIALTCKDYRNIGNIPSSNQSETCIDTRICSK